MAARLWVLAVLATAVLTLLLTACQDENNDPQPNPQAFSIAVTGIAASPHALWIVLHDPGSRRPFAARRVTNDGEVDFGDTGRDRVSVTFAPVNPAGKSVQSTILTYCDVPTGHWSYHSAAPEMLRAQPQGQVTVVCDLPPAPSSSNWSHITALGKCRISRNYPPAALPAVDTATFAAVYPDPNGTVSVFSWLEGDSGMYGGWVLGQPYLPDQQATFGLDLSYPVRPRTMTTSSPITFLDIYGVWGARDEEIRFDYLNNWEPGTAAYTLNVPEGFPAREYHTSARWSSGFDSYYLDSWDETVPAALTLPAGLIDGLYDVATETFSDILYTGAADAMHCRWHHSSGSTLVTWDLVTSPATEISAPPLLPDSVQSEVWIASTDYDYSPSLGLEDYDGLSGYDAFIAVKRSGRPDAASHTRYAAFHQLDNFTSLPD